MKNFIFLLIILSGLFFGTKLIRRLLYELLRKGPYRVQKGDAVISAVSAGFSPRFFFKNDRWIFLTSEGRGSSAVHRLEEKGFRKCFETAGRFSALPLILGESICCVCDDRLEYYESGKLKWKGPVKKSIISSRHISPGIDESFLYFPESVLAGKKKTMRGTESDQAPCIKRFDISDGRLDMALPLTDFTRSRWGAVGGCDTNLVFDGSYFYAGIQSGYLYKIEKKTFMVKWSLKLPGGSRAQAYKSRTDFDFDPIIDRRNVYFGFNGMLAAADKETGEIKTRINYFQDPGSAVPARGHIYFSSMGSIYRLNTDTLESERFFAFDKKYIYLSAAGENMIAALATNRRPTMKRLFTKHDGLLCLIRLSDSSPVFELRIHNIGNPDIIFHKNKIAVLDQDNRVILADITGAI